MNTPHRTILTTVNKAIKNLVKIFTICIKNGDVRFCVITPHMYLLEQ